MFPFVQQTKLYSIHSFSMTGWRYTPLTSGIIRTVSTLIQHFSCSESLNALKHSGGNVYQPLK
jgi:hypothetical protein